MNVRNSCKQHIGRRWGHGLVVVLCSGRCEVPLCAEGMVAHTPVPAEMRARRNGARPGDGGNILYGPPISSANDKVLPGSPDHVHGLVVGVRRGLGHDLPVHEDLDVYPAPQCNVRDGHGEEGFSSACITTRESAPFSLMSTVSAPVAARLAL
jgi:hypothetical protein